MMAGRIRQSVAAMTNDVDRTTHNADVLIAETRALIQETRELVAAVNRLVDVIEKRGIVVGAEVAGLKIPAEVSVKPDSGE